MTHFRCLIRGEGFLGILEERDGLIGGLRPLKWSIHPKWSCEQHKRRISSRGSDHNLHRMRTGATPRR